MVPHYSAAQVRELDRIAIEDFGIPGLTLMTRAGEACCKALHQNWPGVQAVAVCCGTGNNGGDGFVIARLCREAGLDATVFLLGNAAQIRGDACLAYEQALAAAVPVKHADGLPAWLATAPVESVLVDALLGTGLKGKVRADAVALIQNMNTSGLPILAVDIPSGLCSDTGAVLGAAVKAAVTVTFIGRKWGQILGEGPAHCGLCRFDDLQVPQAVHDKLQSSKKRY